MNKTENLCDGCIQRQESIERCKEFLELHPDGKGMICDPTPKVECKWHTFYADCDTDYQKTNCRDYHSPAK